MTANGPESQEVRGRWPEEISKKLLDHLYIIHLLMAPVLAVGGWTYVGYPFNNGWAAVAFVGWMYAFLVIQCVHPPKSGWITIALMLDTPLSVIGVGVACGISAAQGLIVAAFLELFGMPMAMAWSWGLLLFKRRSMPGLTIPASSLIAGIVVMLLLDAGVMGAFWSPLTDFLRGGIFAAVSCLAGLLFAIRGYGRIALSGDFGRFPVTGLLLGLVYMGGAFISVLAALAIGPTLRDMAAR